MAVTNMTRRSFAKLAAFAGAAAAVGVTADAMKPTDKALAEGEDEVYEQKTFCRACPRDCAVIATIRNGVVVKLRGNPDDNMTGGTMCAKGLSGIHALYHPNRTKYPMKRVGERGVDNTWERISWEEAVDMVAAALDNMAKKTGRNGLLVTCGGGGNPHFNDTLAFRYYWGAGHTFEPGAAQCSMPRTFTSVGMMGRVGRPVAIGDGGIGEAANLLHPAPCLVMWGSGGSQDAPAQTGRNITRMREAGGHTICVDPRLTIEGARADVWLPLRAGTDVAMMLCWIKWLIDTDNYDKDFVTNWTNAPFLVNADDNDMTLLRASMVKDMELPNGESFVYYDKDRGVSRVFALSPENEADYNPVLEGTFPVELADGRTIQCKTAFTLLREYAADYDIDTTAEICHSPKEKILEALEFFAAAGEGKSLGSGVTLDQNINSAEMSQGLSILNMLVGAPDKPGSGSCSAPSWRNGEYTWGSMKGLFPNMSRPDRGRFNPNIDKDGNPKRYEKDSYGNPRPLAEDGLPEPFIYYDAQSAIEKFGYIEHKGLGYWAQSLIQGCHHAMLYGDPHPIKVWVERSGNKMAAIADASSWPEALKHLDFGVHHYMYPTSFTFEVADVIMPTTEWLEMTLKADTHGTMAGVKVACAELYEDCDDRFIYGTYFKCLGEKYHDERAYHVYFDDNEYYSIYDHDEYIQDMCATEKATKRKLTWEETKAIAAEGHPLTDEEYWALSEKNYYKYKQVDSATGLYNGFTDNDHTCPLVWKDIEEHPRKESMFHDWLVHCGREGWDVWVEKMPAASEDYPPFPVYRVPIDMRDEETRTKYPIFLSNGRIPFFHHGTLRNAPFLRETYPVPEIWIDPDYAKERGIETGDWVRVRSPRCDIRELIKDGIYAKAWVTEGICRGSAYMERFWNPEFLEPGQDARKSWLMCNYNVLTNKEPPHNPAIGSYTLRGIGVEVIKAERPEGVWYDPEDFEPWMPKIVESTGGGYRS